MIYLKFWKGQNSEKRGKKMNNILNQFTKDGIYQIKCNNPFAKFVVVRTYGTKQLKRAMETMADIKEQISEWDSIYGESLADSIKNKDTQKVSEVYRNYYTLYDANGIIYKEGFVGDLVKELGCSPKTIINVANDESRLMRLKDDNGNFNRFSVRKSRRELSGQTIPQGA